MFKKMEYKLLVLVSAVVLNARPATAILLVIPEDVPTGLVGVYGFAPRIVKGDDARLGFGFRLGNHADFQLLYELGPQTHTRPIEPIRARSASYSVRERVVKRRPLLELLLRAGLIRDVTYEVSVNGDRYEPR